VKSHLSEVVTTSTEAQPGPSQLSHPPGSCSLYSSCSGGVDDLLRHTLHVPQAAAFYISHQTIPATTNNTCRRCPAPFSPLPACSPALYCMTTRWYMRPADCNTTNCSCAGALSVLLQDCTAHPARTHAHPSSHPDPCCGCRRSFTPSTR
jgi:hypothetical protein